MATTTELDYGAEPARALEHLMARPWAAFLDSGFGGSRAGRFDVLTADPYATLTTRGGTTTIATRDAIRRSRADPLKLLRRYLGPLEPHVPDLPFAGGALGYFAYDLGRRLEPLPSIAAVDVDLPEMAVGIYDWAVVVDHERRRAWFVSRGRDASSASALDELRAPSRTARRGERPFRILSPTRCNFDRARYQIAFDRIRQHIRDGDCYQVNLAQRFEARAGGDSWQAYQSLRRSNPAPFSAYLRFPFGAVLSSSPERFLELRGDRVRTQPIKGTRPRSPDPVRDSDLAKALRLSVKDRAENVMIVDLLRNDLGKTCMPGTIEVEDLFAVESFASVHHLVSTVTGRLAPGRHALDLLRGCFPGGSITGAPKLRAMQIIEQLEPHRRGVYCGAIGYVGFDGDMDLNIAIRTLVQTRESIYAWAGGGIVADSEAQAEYQESLDKAAALLAILNRRAEGENSRGAEPAAS